MKHIAEILDRTVAPAAGSARAQSSSTYSSTSAADAPLADSLPSATGSDRPRERLASLGAGALSDAELLALMLRTGSGGTDALGVAQLLLATCGGLSGLRRASEGDLLGVPGLGPAKTASIGAAIEMGRRLAARRLRPGDAIRGPVDIHRHYHPRLRDLANEHFVAMLLDSRHRILKEVVVSQGTLTASLVHPREVFRRAVSEAAAAIVLVHNHPSGDPSPSSEDRRVTQRLSEAGMILGIRVIDHVVVAEDGYFSFSEAGELPGVPGATSDHS